MSELIQDLVYAIRSLRRAPTVWTTCSLVLAIGVGATTAIFSLIDVVLLRPTDFQPSESLIRIRELRPNGEFASVAPVEFDEWRHELEVGPFENVGAYYRETVVITGASEPERVDSARVSAEFFDVLRAPLQVGRAFQIDEERPTARPVAIVSRRLWERYFGSSGLAGQTLTIDDVPTEIVGIARHAFGFPEGRDLWRPAALNTGQIVRTHYLSVIARLKPGLVSGAAREYVNRTNSHASVSPGGQPHTVQLTSLLDAVVGEFKFALFLLFGAVGLVLLLSSCSVASMLFARAARRQRQIAMLVTLGASRGRLIRQLLAEAVLVALPAAALGLLIGGVALYTLLTRYPESVAGVTSVPLNTTVVAFAISIALIASVLSSLLPALNGTSGSVIALLKESSTAVVGGSPHVMRGLLTSAQCAIAVLLLFGAGVMLKSSAYLSSVNPGFDGGRVITLRTNLPASRYSGSRAAAFYTTLFERLKAGEGIHNVSAVLGLPFQGGTGRASFTVQGGLEGLSMSEPAAVHINVVGPEYFKTMGIPLVSGRDFTTAEAALPNSLVIVNERLATRAFGTTPAVGRFLTVHYSSNKETVEIIGVVGDVRQSRLEDAAEPEIYWSRLRSPYMTVVVRTEHPNRAADVLKTAVHSIDPHLPVEPKSMQAIVNGTTRAPALRAAVLAVLAASALVIAAVGLGGFVAFRVSERLAEFGLRVALGGEFRHIVLAIVRSEIVWPVLGGLAGVIGGLGSTRILRAFVYGVQPMDVASLSIAVSILFVSVALASFPAVLNALRVDPTILVRQSRI